MISIICAMGINRAIGKDHQLIYRIPADLTRFQELTTGHSVIMGRKTFESIGHALPHRRNIILSRNPNLEIPVCTVCGSINTAIQAAGKGEVFIIGGGEVFHQSLPLADKLYLTVINEAPAADTFFPDYSSFKTTLAQDQHSAGNLTFYFLTLAR